MLAMSSTLEEKIARIVRVLSSDRDGEVLAAVHQLKRVLASHNTDFNGLANGIEKFGNMNGNDGSLSEGEMEKIYHAGYAKGVEDAENKLHGIDGFRSTNGNSPAWEAVAHFLQRNKHRLDSKHHDFVDDMAARTAWGREPTEKQHKYLRSLFFKLGGKIT
jgi:hypothetical protein